MASLRRRGKVWYFRYVDADGIKREERGCGDKRVTEEMARGAESHAARIRAGLIDPRAEAIRRHEARGLADHLAEWRRALIAKGGTVKHASLHFNRATRLVTLAGSDLIGKLTPSKIQAALAQLRDDGLSAQSVNHHRAALRNFCRWMVADGRTRDNPMIGVNGFNVAADRRHVRRSLTKVELTRLIRATEDGVPFMGLDGPTRALCYRVAASTGLRAAEIRSLTVASFHLDGEGPRIACKAGYTKNGESADQPIPQALAGDLGRWLAEKPEGTNVFPLPRETAIMIRADLKAAGIPYRDADGGVADFHSLRAVYATHLISGGASVKTTQHLLRHSTPTLTIGTYCKLDVHDVKGAVDRLPSLTSRADPQPEAMLATGTNGNHIAKPVAHYLPTVGDGSGRNVTVGDATLDVQAVQYSADSSGRNPLELTPLDDLRLVETERRGRDSNPRDPCGPYGFQDRPAA